MKWNRFENPLLLERMVVRRIIQECDVEETTGAKTYLVVPGERRGVVLEFLYAADLIERALCRGPDVWLRFRPPGHPVARVLLSVLLDEVENGMDYRNRVSDHHVDGATRRIVRKISIKEGCLNGGWMRKKMMNPVKGRMTEDVVDVFGTDDDC